MEVKLFDKENEDGSFDDPCLTVGMEDGFVSLEVWGTERKYKCITYIRKKLLLDILNGFKISNRLIHVLFSSSKDVKVKYGGEDLLKFQDHDIENGLLPDYCVEVSVGSKMVYIQVFEVALGEGDNMTEVLEYYAFHEELIEAINLLSKAN